MHTLVNRPRILPMQIIRTRPQHKRPQACGNRDKDLSRLNPRPHIPGRIHQRRNRLRAPREQPGGGVLHRDAPHHSEDVTAHVGYANCEQEDVVLVVYGIEREDYFIDTGEYQDPHAYRDEVGDGDLGDVGGYP